ncbi:MAG TPA: hypothetical protein VFU21_02380 [Kofleriaceae bacterium]|nr:hypothetical protein [Kofleriaceae bacterium]
MAVGFIIEDARGFKYILKFDGQEYPEAETAADAVVQRLLWAAGYNVPENYVVRFRREDLLLSAESVIEDRLGNEKPMSEAFVARQLSRIAVEEDGSLRGLASKYLDGEPVGGHLRDGVRPDDPNDRVPHELRRELRGAYPLFAWVDHADAKVDNTLDMYVRDPVDPEVRYLVHYLVDFGKSLGAYGLTSRYKAQGRAYIYDFHDMALSLVTVGLWRRPWEGREWPRHLRGVGIFESRTFHPGRWKPATPGYFPFLDLDRFDGFWGAKIVARFTPEHIRAAVEQGRYSDPRAIDYITRTLLERQRMTVRYWFARVAPLDRFAVVAGAGGERLCFEDLALRYRLSGSAPAASRYRARAYDRDGRETGWRAVGAGTRHGRACLPPLRAAPGRDGYTIVRIETDRPGHDLPAVLVHLAREPRRGALRVIGLRRL